MQSRMLYVLGVVAIGGLLSTKTEAADVGPNLETPPVQLQLTATYNSNITASSAAIAQQRGLSQVDEIYSPALNLNYAHQLGQFLYFLSGQAGYDFHQNDTILNRERIGAQAGVNSDFGFCQMNMKGSYARNQSDLQDLVVGVNKNTQQTITPDVNGTCNSTGRFVPSIDVQNTWQTASSVLMETTDFISFAPSGSLLYHAGSVGDISLIGNYTSTEFPHRILLVGPSEFSDGYSLYSGGIRFARQFGSTISFSLSISDASVTPDAGLGAKFSGLTYISSLTYEVTPRLNAVLNISRQTLPSNRLGVNFSVDQLYSGELDYRLSSRLSAKLGAGNIGRTFEGTALDTADEISRESDWNFYGSLGFDVTPRLSVSLTATQQERHADLAGYSYSATIIRLAVTKAF